MKLVLVALSTLLVAAAAYATWGDNPSVLGALPVQFSATSAVAPYSKFHQFGMTDAQQQNVTEVVFDGQSLASVFGGYKGQDPTVAARVSVVSASPDDTLNGDGAQTVEIFGLDQNFLKIDEVVNLTGATTAFTNQNFLRFFRGVVRSAGDLGSNVGRIQFRNADDDTIVYAAMFSGVNQTLAATYTIPDGKVGFVTAWYGSQSSDVPANTDVRLIYGPPQQPKAVKEVWGLRTGGTDTFERKYFIPKGPLPPRTDLRISAFADQPLQNTSAGFDVVLFDVE